MRFILVASVALAAGTLMSGEVHAQCSARGGGSGPSSLARGSSPGGFSGTLLTSPGSYAYDLMIQQRIMAVQQQRMYYAQLAKARKKQALTEKRLAAARQRRADELYARQKRTDARLAAREAASRSSSSLASR